MDFPFQLLGAEPLQWAGTGAVALYAWFLSRQRITNERLQQLDRTYNERVVHLEERLSRVPGPERWENLQGESRPCVPSFTACAKRFLQLLYPLPA